MVGILPHNKEIGLNERAGSEDQFRGTNHHLVVCTLRELPAERFQQPADRALVLTILFRCHNVDAVEQFMAVTVIGERAEVVDG